MSINFVLDEITENIQSVSVENMPTETILNNGQNNASHCNLNVEKIPNNVLSKINNMFNLMLIKKNIVNVERVSYSVAREVFTMIPDAENNISEQAKLTRSPSFINKEIVDRVFNNYTGNNCLPIIDHNLRDIKTVILDNLNKFDDISSYLDSFINTVTNKLEQLKDSPALITFLTKTASDLNSTSTQSDQINKPTQTTLNLLSSPLRDIYYSDDTQLNYQKYSGVLSSKYMKLYTDTGLQMLPEFNSVNLNKENISLSLIVSSVYTLRGIIKKYKENAENNLNNLNTILDNTGVLDENLLCWVNNINQVISEIETAIKLYELIKTTDNCLEKTSELILFI